MQMLHVEAGGGGRENHWNQQAESPSTKACCCPLSLHSTRRPGWRGLGGQGGLPLLAFSFSSASVQTL